MTHTAAAALPEVLKGLLRMVEGAGGDFDNYLGDHWDFAISQIRRHDDDEQRHYAGLVTLATLKVEETLSELSTPQQRAQWRLVVEMRWNRTSVDDQTVPCPVCGFPTYVTGSLDHVGWEASDWDEDGIVSDAYRTFEYRPSTLKCITCGLRLETPSLIGLSGAMENWELSEDDDIEVNQLIAEDDAADAWVHRDR